jgi:murein L,D-transpeptidase YafK
MEFYWLYFKVRETGQKFFPVHIFPFRLDKFSENQWANKTPAKTHIDFWKNIREGYDFFEKNKKLPKYSFGSSGEYIFEQ